MVGIVCEVVSFAHHSENGRLLPHAGKGGHRLVRHGRSFGVRKAEEIAEVVIPAPGDQVFIIQREDLFQERKHFPGNIRIKQKTGGHTFISLADRFLHLLKQIARDLVIYV